MLLSDSRIYMPGGRSTPFYFDRRTGKRLGQFAKGNGMGSFALLADNRIFHGPADRSGGVLTEAGLTGDKAASHTDALDMIVDAQAMYLLSPDKVTAMTRSNRRARWSEPVEAGNSLALAGDTLFVGSAGRVRPSMPTADASSGAKPCRAARWGWPWPTAPCWSAPTPAPSSASDRPTTNQAPGFYSKWET